MVYKPADTPLEVKDGEIFPPKKIIALGTERTLGMVSLAISGGRKGHTKGKKALKGDGTVFSTISQIMPFMKFRFPDNKVYKVTQLVEVISALGSSNVAFSTDARNFTYNALPQQVSFTAVFDQYRITEIEFWVVPRNPNSATGAAVNRGLLYTVIDYDDSTTLGNGALFEDYSNCVVSPATEGQYRRFVPHTATAAYAGAFTSYQNNEMQWFDTSFPAVQHYGVKIGVSTCDSAANEVGYDYMIRYHLDFRNLR